MPQTQSWRQYLVFWRYRQRAGLLRLSAVLYKVFWLVIIVAQKAIFAAFILLVLLELLRFLCPRALVISVMSVTCMYFACMLLFWLRISLIKLRLTLLLQLRLLSKLFLSLYCSYDLLLRCNSSILFQDLPANARQKTCKKLPCSLFLL